MMISFSNWASWVLPIGSEPEAMPSNVYPIMAQLAFGQELGRRNRLNQCDLQIRHRSNSSTEHSDQIKSIGSNKWQFGAQNGTGKTWMRR